MRHSKNENANCSFVALGKGEPLFLQQGIRRNPGKDPPWHFASRSGERFHERLRSHSTLPPTTVLQPRRIRSAIPSQLGSKSRKAVLKAHSQESASLYLFGRRGLNPPSSNSTRLTSNTSFLTVLSSQLDTWGLAPPISRAPQPAWI